MWEKHIKYRSDINAFIEKYGEELVINYGQVKYRSVNINVIPKSIVVQDQTVVGITLDFFIMNLEDEVKATSFIMQQDRINGF